jgi:hypothetical protein
MPVFLGDLPRGLVAMMPACRSALRYSTVLLLLLHSFPKYTRVIMTYC